VLCREQSLKLWAEREKFAAAGVKLVLVVHEWIDREIKGFAPEYWGALRCLRARLPARLPACAGRRQCPVRLHPAKQRSAAKQRH